jgi:hypothetical protein
MQDFSGRQTVDGLPFQVGGQIRLYGVMAAEHGDKPDVETVKGISIGRKFDELHLIHHALWADVEGETIAYLTLNYEDGTQHIFPIRYGVHVRDWNNLPSYERETPSDPDTKICWRREPIAFNAPIRLFKSRLVNPLPQKAVTTMDLVSARNQAQYTLVAATVTNRRPSKPKWVGDRQFDNRIAIRVVDSVTGKPIEHAIVLVHMNVQDQGVVGTPFYTNADGAGDLRFPAKSTQYVGAQVKKAGYESASKTWDEAAPDAYTFELKPTFENESP